MKNFLSLIFIFCLFGCNQKPLTYDYLMQHPTVLKEKFADCNDATSEHQEYCTSVKQAARDFMLLVDEHNNDPIKFGKMVMTLQDEMARLKTQNDQVEKLKQDHTKLKIYYAVIATTTAE